MSDAVEYCQFETFNATCPADHVIMMEHAQYGRPHTGRCIARDYGYVGCSMSVVHLLDRICSGRQSCHLEVPSLRDIVQPCPRDLITFLDVSYHCVIGQYVKCIINVETNVLIAYLSTLFRYLDITHINPLYVLISFLKQLRFLMSLKEDVQVFCTKNSDTS